MRNSDVAHQFMYDLSGYFCRNSMNVWYNNQKYYSYGTCIGQIEETLSGARITILSDNNFSNTTAKHINELRSASRFTTVYLPISIYDKEFRANEIYQKITDSLEYYSQSKLTQQANRQAFNKYYNMLDICLDLKMFQPYFDGLYALKETYSELHKFLKDYTQKDKNKIKEIEQKRQEKLKEELKTIIENNSYLELIELAFKNQNTDKQLQRKIKDYLNPDKDLSFIWFTENYCKTSQHITVKKDDVISLLKLWNKGKLKHGMTISYYTVMAVTDNFVQVGCHKIPTANLKALFDSINIKQVA